MINKPMDTVRWLLHILESGVIKIRTNPKIFLNKLNWDVNMGKLKQIDTFRVDVYQFIFEHPLKDELLRAFTGFIKTLPMREVRSVMKVWVWLYQQDIKFRLKYSWNENLPVLHNIKNLMEPGKVNQKLKSFSHEELMGCQLERSN